MVQILNLGLPGGDSSINMEIIPKKNLLKSKGGQAHPPCPCCYASYSKFLVQISRYFTLNYYILFREKTGGLLWKEVKRGRH